MHINVDSVVNQLFSGGTALAGLILVFLGGVLAAYESTDPAQRSDAVRKQYKRRAWLSFGGFATALVAAILAFVANWCPQGFWIVGSIATLAGSFLLVLLMALKVTREIN